METDHKSWMDDKFREKQFWNINVAWIYWGSVAQHLSPMASPSCCMFGCGPFKWTDLGCTVIGCLSWMFVCLPVGRSMCLSVLPPVTLLVSHTYLTGRLSCLTSVSTFRLKSVPSGSLSVWMSDWPAKCLLVFPCTASSSTCLSCWVFISYYVCGYHPCL